MAVGERCARTRTGRLLLGSGDLRLRRGQGHALRNPVARVVGTTLPAAAAAAGVASAVGVATYLPFLMATAVSGRRSTRPSGCQSGL